MKYIIAIFLCSFSIAALAQKMPDEGFNKVRITLSDLTILAEINPVSSNPTVKSNLFYFWYEANAIHSTQGGFSGKLLNGLYSEYYPERNLKRQGSFKKGLKSGLWKSWNRDGTLAELTKWKMGIQISNERVPLWRRLPFLRSKKDKPATDTLKKAG